MKLDNIDPADGDVAAVASGGPRITGTCCTGDTCAMADGDLPEFSDPRPCWGRVSACDPFGDLDSMVHVCEGHYSLVEDGLSMNRERRESAKYVDPPEPGAHRGWCATNRAVRHHAPRPACDCDVAAIWGVQP